MKFFILSLASFFALQCCAQQPEIVLGPGIEIEDHDHDFGEVQQTDFTEYIYCEFTIKNIGTEPLIISKCKGTCGCTTPECSQEPILPGETGTVRVRYDSYRVGNFAKSVTLYSNATNEPEKKIWIRGTVIERTKG